VGAIVVLGVIQLIDKFIRLTDTKEPEKPPTTKSL
jgi:hypothetical protein